MKLTTQEEYGLRCLLQIARQGAGASLTIAELSEREGISSPNVAKIMRILRRGGLVKSTRGKSGGYTLTRGADAVHVGEVLGTLGGRLFDGDFCEKHAGVGLSCANTGDCSIRPVLRYVQEAVDHVLGRLTLESLLAPEQEITTTARPKAIPLPLLR